MIADALARLSAPRVRGVPIVSDGAPSPPPTRTLRIATWNIAWAQGWGSELSGRGALRSQAQIDEALHRMAAHLRAERVDVALLQEVDLRAQRSGDIDQARVLSQRAGLPWIAAAASWDVPYLPYPYWPPSAHTGRVRSGGAILSRYPLRAAWIELLPKPRARSAWYRAFYLSRYLMGAVVDAGDGVAVQLLHTHLEAFDLDNRRLQAGMLASRLASVVHEARVVFGGDLNTIPPEAAQRHDYPDEPHTDHRQDPSYPVIAAVPGLRSVIPEGAIARDPAAHHTFPAHAPNRTLDHLFVSGAIEVESAVVGRQAGDASDHLPLHARLRLLSRA